MRRIVLPHAIRIWQEKKWPYQWIGMCSCGNGIRCNSKADAQEFFAKEGCRQSGGAQEEQGCPIGPRNGGNVSASGGAG